ncbi:DUF4192 family protein [Streptomyces sp. CAU 1734]|uniref:DUF4192 domain-containing protein n=1 Tax=Streptomyces sp. CAU 1734 TaxID=3140360 RepID=UPI003260BDE1
MNKHQESMGHADEPQITLRGPAELADALPYMLGYHPTDSVVMVALHGSRGRFGGRARLGIPASEREWPPVARQLAESLIEGSERRGARPDGIVVFLCQDPARGESGNQVMERLRPLAQRLRTACGELDVPVYEALCISDGRYWSYCCPDERCCPPEGSAMAVPGTSVMAAAAAYAGIRVRGSLRELEARLEPSVLVSVKDQETALDKACARLVPRLLSSVDRAGIGEETIALSRSLIERLAGAERTPETWDVDGADDLLITDDEAAAVILGMQDRETRDRAAAWMEGPDTRPALRLWRALARRCVGAYSEHAAAPLTLAAWVAWSTGDETGARVALGLALRKDPEYVFARLLHEACNEGLDPEELRACFRRERGPGEAGREIPETVPEIPEGLDMPGAPEAGDRPAAPHDHRGAAGPARVRRTRPPGAARTPRPPAGKPVRPAGSGPVKAVRNRRRAESRSQEEGEARR